MIEDATSAEHDSDYEWREADEVCACGGGGCVCEKNRDERSEERVREEQRMVEATQVHTQMRMVMRTKTEQV